MDFELTSEQREWQAHAREFAQPLASNARAREQAGEIPVQLRREAGALGLIAPELPARLGGRDTDRLTTGLVTEAIGYGDSNVAYLQVVGSLVGQVLAENAAPGLAKTWVRGICSGERIVGIGLSEPDAGSDAGAARMTAVHETGGWRITGTKSLSLCMLADAAVVFAKTDPAAPRGRGISALLVPLDSDGITRERFDDMGTTSVARGAIHLQDAFVPDDHLLGAEGAGFTQVMQGFDFSRALIGLQVIGAAQASVDETWAYVSERTAFDQPLSKFQGVAFPLAEVETQLAAARLLCYQTLWLKDHDEPHTTQAAMCKWWAPKVAAEAIQQCLLLHGSMGYRKDLPHERRLRDVLGLQIGDGTAQIMKLIIARQRVGRELAP